MKRIPWTVFALVAMVATLAIAAPPSSASDGYDIPAAERDGRTDINDLYVFTSPENPANTVFVLTVRENASSKTFDGLTFHPDDIYQIRIDTNGDSKTDKRIKIKFGAVKAYGPDNLEAHQTMQVSDNLVEGRGEAGTEIALTNGGKVKTGVFDNPFFLDGLGFRNGLGDWVGPGYCRSLKVDAFGKRDVLAIVIEIPTASISPTSTKFGVWAETRKPSGARIDRVGKPGTSLFLIKQSDKSKLNKSNPRFDRRVFGPQVRDRLIELSFKRYDMADAQLVVNRLLPDILTIDVSKPTAYPNGRALADDVFDIVIKQMSRGWYRGDCIDNNDRDFRSTFPYLAKPWLRT